MNLTEGRPGVLMLMSLNADSSYADSSGDYACLSADSSLMLIRVETVLIPEISARKSCTEEIQLHNNADRTERKEEEQGARRQPPPF